MVASVLLCHRTMYDKRELSRFGATDVIEKKDSLVFEVDAPGCSKDDFNIEVSPLPT